MKWLLINYTGIGMKTYKLADMIKLAYKLVKVGYKLQEWLIKQGCAKKI